MHLCRNVILNWITCLQWAIHSEQNENAFCNKFLTFFIRDLDLSRRKKYKYKSDIQFIYYSIICYLQILFCDVYVFLIIQRKNEKNSNFVEEESE